MSNQLVRPETLTSATARHIGDAIVRGEHAPETALPEASLARSLKVSRGTVREALRLLADDGLVEIFPHRGAWVAPLSVRTVRETYSLRVLLEPYAAKLAMEQGGLQKAVPDVEAALATLERAARDGTASTFVDADLAFHEAISRAADHGALHEILSSIRSKVRRYMFWGRVTDASDVWIEYEPHAEILDIIRGGDPQQVEQVVRDHITRAGDMLLALLDSRDQSDNRPGHR